MSFVSLTDELDNFSYKWLLDYLADGRLMDPSGIGKRMRLARRRKNISIAKLAKQIGTTKQQLDAVEAGYVLRPKNAVEIAEALEVHPLWLQYGIPEEKARLFDLILEIPDDAHLPVSKLCEAFIEQKRSREKTGSNNTHD